MSPQHPLCALLICLCLSLLSATASAQIAPTPEQKAEIEALVLKGSDHYDSGRFQEAIKAYEAAYKLYPHPDFLWNIARSHEQLGRLKVARSRFQMIEGFSFAVPPSSEHEQRLQQLRQAARGEISKIDEMLQLREEAITQARQAQHSGDHQAALEQWTRAAQLSSDMETHLGRAEALLGLGRQAEAGAILNLIRQDSSATELERSRVAELQARLSPQEQAPEPQEQAPEPQVAAPPPSEPQASSPDHTWAWVTLGTGGVVLLGSLGYRLAYQGHLDRYEELSPGPVRDDLKQELDTYNTAFLGGALLGGLLTAGGVAWLLWPQEEQAPPQALRWHIGPGSVGLQGQF